MRCHRNVIVLRKLEFDEIQTGIKKFKGPVKINEVILYLSEGRTL